MLQVTPATTRGAQWFCRTVTSCQRMLPDAHKACVRVQLFSKRCDSCCDPIAVVRRLFRPVDLRAVREPRKAPLSRHPGLNTTHVYNIILQRGNRDKA
jgi:hypothetical protein